MRTKPRPASLAAASASLLAALAVLAYPGCSSGSSPASPDDDAAADAPILIQPPDGSVQCSPSKAFGTPTLVPGFEARDASSARLTANELVLYFDDGAHLQFATRTSRTSAFGASNPVPGVSSPKADLSPWVSADDKTLLFASTRDVDGGSPGTSRLYRARRDSASLAFGSVEEIPGLPTGESFEPYLRDGVELWFTQDKGTGFGRDLLRAPITGGTFGALTDTSELSDPAPDRNPVISADGRTIYFQSTRTPSQKSDIWMATRSDTSKKFASLTNAASLNSASEDAPTWISPDNCRLYLSSDRPLEDGGSPKLRLYVAERAP
ncbi:TolB family protein [Pendulispora albinea]|uniref:Uncharacterized protein n=1 Tax=Pendulispora albinea TaxID=2741071 RepID=A0ABZ2LTY7_9BACT